MNTEKYLKFLRRSLDEGEIPRELYDVMVAEIEKSGKMNRKIYRFFLSELERRRLFNVKTEPINYARSAVTDGTYKYSHRKNPFWNFGHGVTALLFKLLGGYLLGGIVYGAWRVKDRKKLKKLKGGFITTSNHVGYVDAFLTRRAMGFKKQYIVAAPYNCKRTLGGGLLKMATMLPLPSSVTGVRAFNEELKYVASRGAAIHFYAEQTMWIRYEKPRPYKEGAFYYADMLDVPVVPMFYCFKEPKGLRRLFGLPRADVRIGDPIYSDKSLPKNERKADMARRAYAAAVAMYEDFNGKPLEYLPEYVGAERADTAETEERTNDEIPPDSTADGEEPIGAENIINNENTTTRESDYVKNDSDS